MLMALFDTTRGGCRMALQAKPARLAMMLVWEGACLDPRAAYAVQWGMRARLITLK